MTDDKLVQLSAAIDADPCDRELYEVYADELQRHGDPRGELIVLQLAEVTPDREERARVLIDTLFPASPLLHRCQWRWGFLESAELHVRDTTAEAIHDALDHPSMRFATELWIPATEGGLQPVIDALAGRPRPALQHLVLGVTSLDDQPATSHDLGSLSHLWARLPNLQTLLLAGQNLTLGALTLPRLRFLDIDSIALRPDAIDAVLREPWSELTSLALGFGTSSIPETLRDLLAHPLPAVRSMMLRGTFIDDVIDVLIRSPMLGRLRKLSIRGLTDRGAARILAHADAFAHLAKLDLVRNYLTPEVMTGLASVAKEVLLADQQDPIERDPDLYDY